ncbi:hypothetical protein M422DRAFT_780993 [Sphaerobolus stellatus SS14]|uniref:Uncharacterized protein n=1 Tax=Sphaerobolus stellatus (strain SS14) TaxID=990650 RepID=A0A0C9U927_SPHS4|nr:hypothetical protein M422DRAFT_780993 [Sphaerobolus stellatus SS14]
MLQLQDILNNMDNGQIEGFELAVHLHMNDYAKLRHVDLDHLSSFHGPASVLCHIITLADNLRVVKLWDTRDNLWIEDVVALDKPMRKVSYVHLPFVHGPEQVQKVKELWPSMTVLSVSRQCSNPYRYRHGHVAGTDLASLLSYFPQIEELRLSNCYCWHLTQSAAFELYTVTTLRPQTSRLLRVVHFAYGSEAHWNSVDAAWEFYMNGGEGSGSASDEIEQYTYASEEIFAASDIVKNHLMTWHNSNIPNPRLKPETRMESLWSSIKRLFFIAGTPQQLPI